MIEYSRPSGIVSKYDLVAVEISIVLTKSLESFTEKIKIMRNGMCSIWMDNRAATLKAFR